MTIIKESNQNWRVAEGFPREGCLSWDLKNERHLSRPIRDLRLKCKNKNVRSVTKLDCLISWNYETVRDQETATSSWECSKGLLSKESQASKKGRWKICLKNPDSQWICSQKKVCSWGHNARQQSPNWDTGTPGHTWKLSYIIQWCFWEINL